MLRGGVFEVDMKGFERFFFESPGEGVRVVFIPGIDQPIKVRRGLVVCPACNSIGRELLASDSEIRCPGCIGEIKVERIMRKAAKARKESERQALFREAVRIRKRNEEGSADNSDKAALARLAAILSGGG